MKSLDRSPCKGCGSFSLFMCYHTAKDKPYREGYSCGYCTKCCPDRLKVIDSLPEEDRKRASKAICLIPE